MERTTSDCTRRSAAVLLLGAACLLGAGAASGQVYKWKDAKGVVHYGDRPPASRNAVELKEPGSGAQPAALPYALARAAKDHPVTLYTASACEPCDAGRALLRGRGVPFTEKTVSTAGDQRQLKQAGSDGQLPLLLVGHGKLIGFEAQAWNGALDAAAYPVHSMLPPDYRAAAAERAEPPQAKAPATVNDRDAIPEEAPRKLPPVNAPPDFQF